jgi:hypothetical protein
VDKYFTPSIEDIRVGYECERHVVVDFSTTGEGAFEWQKYIIGEDYNPDLRDGKDVRIPSIRLLRTPYLTKEQIETEGWEDISTSLNENNWGFQKGNRFAAFKSDKEGLLILQIIIKDPSKEELVFGIPSENFRFICPCKDINTFRYICKLLKV